MCGIIGYIGKRGGNEASSAVLDQYEDQFSRGTQGFGLIEITKRQTKIRRATEPVKAILDLKASKAPIVLFHHRMPTSTPNKMRQTHPLVINHDELSKDWYVIHNGIIRDADDLFKVHTEELGYTYKTFIPGQSTGYYNKEKFNDSEAVAIEIARYFEGKSKLINTVGSAAFIAYAVDKVTKKGEIFWGRNTNPLYAMPMGEGLLLASELESYPESVMVESDSAKSLSVDEVLANGALKAKIEHYDLIFKKAPPVTSNFGFHTSDYWNNRTSETKKVVDEIETAKKDVDEKEPSNQLIPFGDEPEEPVDARFQLMAEDMIEEANEVLNVYLEELMLGEFEGAEDTFKELQRVLNKHRDEAIKIHTNYDLTEISDEGRSIGFAL